MKLHGFPIISGRIDLPRLGNWSADLVIDAPDVANLSGKGIALDLDEADGGMTLACTVTQGTTFVERTRVAVVGGAGGLGMFLQAKDYKDAPARIPITDALTEAGERLAGTSSGIDTMLPSWTRPAASASQGLSLLIAKLGTAWRVLPDGAVWFGKEQWPASKATKVLVLDEDGSSGRLHVHAEAANILPGTLLEGRKVSQVSYVIRPDFFEAIVYVERAEARTMTLTDHLSRLVNFIMARVDFHALYPSKVVVQHADGSVDVEVDDPKIPDKSKVAIRLGLPGVKVKVKAGARVLLGFEGGDPAKPFVSLWEFDGMTEISFAGGAQGVARVGDAVSLTLPPGTPFVGPGGTITNIGPVRIVGTILTGSAKVRA